MYEEFASPGGGSVWVFQPDTASIPAVGGDSGGGLIPSWGGSPDGGASIPVVETPTPSFSFPAPVYAGPSDWQGVTPPGSGDIPWAVGGTLPPLPYDVQIPAWGGGELPPADWGSPLHPAPPSRWNELIPSPPGGGGDGGDGGGGGHGGGGAPPTHGDPPSTPTTPAGPENMFDWAYKGWQELADPEGKYTWYAQNVTKDEQQRAAWEKQQRDKQKADPHYVPQPYVSAPEWTDMSQPLEAPGSPDGKAITREYWKFRGAPVQSWFDQQERTRPNASLWGRTGMGQY